ncbi:branched-chain amino acid transaminase [Hydrotalea sandarakina]|uniref:Branched-chain-amino-acid aminotransferase n=1 Tax=Hydrotalea sandarakina TaxID=1004304 RepID=A0A2W7TJX5_9BACT|nr:branched-chain amino acid transaminase [Hydrotalea sandarakina]PZX63532.1 branched-chain amino acid aminotransferase [Hydrotalea sandarakina]
MYYNQNTFIYFNGSYIKAADATTDLYSQTLHYGYGVFEGIRSYKTVTGQTKIFKAEAHFERLRQSALALNLPYTYSVEELIEASYKVLALNDLQDAYIRPLVFAPANMSFAKNTVSHIAIEAWRMEPFLGNKMLRVVTSSFERPNPKAFHIHAKATGHYVNSILASQEAKQKGFDEALLLDMHGYIAEAPGANVFFEKNGTLFTPQLGNILPGITRATILDLCSELNIPVKETKLKLEDIYHADAAFFCGTAAEVIGIESLDNKPFTKPWAETISRLIQTSYKNLITENQKTILNEVLGTE